MAVPADQMPPMVQMDVQPYELEIEEELPEYEETTEGNPLLKFLDKGNLVDELEDNKKETADIMGLYDEANKSMEPWKKKYKRALNLAKLQAMAGDVEITEKTFPFEGASVAMLPYILEAMLDFNSRAAPELVWAKEIVKAKIYGAKTDEKEERAQRVANFSNYQLSELIPNWRDDQDKGLLILAAPGTFYKNTYWDGCIKEVRSELCLADEVIFNHDYKSFDVAPDKFLKREYTKNDVITFIRGEQEWDIDEDELDDDEQTFEFIEAHTWIDLDDDGLKEPYIAIIWKEKEKIVCLYPDYDEDTVTINEDDEIVKAESLDCFTQYRFMPDPEGGPMGMGWGILLGSMFDSINTNMRQLLDAGTLLNTASNSGLISQTLAKGRGNAVQSGPIEVKMGELTPISSHGSGSLRDNIVQFPFSGPSPVLFQLLEYMVQSARSMTNAATTTEANAGEAASLYLARLQQGLKVPNSIIMRVYECAKREFQKIAKLNYKNFDNEKYNDVIDDDVMQSMERDFDPEDCDIRMAANPAHGSDIERVQRAQVVYEMAKDPQQPEQVLDYRQSVIDVLEAMNTPNIEELAPEPDPNAKDPMQEMMIAQAMAEMEVTQGNLDIRRQELTLKKQKIALDAAKEQTRLGLSGDEQEAKITKMYAETLKILVEAGITQGEQAMNAVQRIEDRFIGDNSARGTTLPPGNAGPVGNMAGQPSNPKVPPVPPMVR